MTTNDRIIEKASKDLVWWGKKIAPWEFLEESPPFHYEIAEHLLDPQVRKLVIEAPRGTAKSTLIRTFIFWHIFISDYAYGREPYPKTITVLTKTGKAVRGEMLKIQRVLENSKILHALFGYQGKDACKTWTWNELFLKGGHRILYQGAGQQARMMRTTLAIGDDTEDEGNTKTSEAIEKNFKTFTGGYLNTLDHFRGDKVIDIGTPVCANCTVERLMEESRSEKKLITMANGTQVWNGWVGLHYSAIVRDDPNDPLESGRPLWPEAHSMDYLLSERDVAESFGTLSVWYAEQMCQVVSDQDKFFELLGYYRGSIEIVGGKHYLKLTHRSDQTASRNARLETLKEQDEPDMLPVNVFMGVDPASSTHDRADRSVVMAVALDAKGNYYVLPYWAGREKPLDVRDKVLQQNEMYKPLRINVETVAWQTALKDMLLEKGVWAAADGGKPKQKKDDRLGNGLQPIFGSGKMWLQPEGMGLLESELDVFPGRFSRDALDALFYAVKNAYGPMHGPVESMQQKKKEASQDTGVVDVSMRYVFMTVPGLFNNSGNDDLGTASDPEEDFYKDVRFLVADPSGIYIRYYHEWSPPDGQEVEEEHTFISLVDTYVVTSLSVAEFTSQLEEALKTYSVFLPN